MDTTLNKTPYIIAVDDEADLLFLFQQVITKKGCEVKTSVCGANLWELIKLRIPDIIFLDILMGSVNGGDICHELKAHPLTEKIPVILLSGNQDIEQIALQSGADGWLQKPFDADKIMNEVYRFTMPDSQQMKPAV